MSDFSVILPFNFVNGTTADANEVNANFRALRNKHNEAFNGTTGHKHTGTTGDAPILGASSLNLAGTYNWTGPHTHANNVDIYSGFDLRLFSDAGITQTAGWDSATGNITTIGLVDGVDISVHDHTGGTNGVNVPIVAGTSGILTVLRGGTGVTTSTGTGSVVLNNTPTLLTPAIADFTNAQHNHSNVVNGGLISSSAISGFIDTAHGGTNHGNYTAGSVIFAGPGGTSLTEDNANFFWDDATNRLGLGTATPGTRLDIFGAGQVTARVRTDGTGFSPGSLLRLPTSTTDWGIACFDGVNTMQIRDFSGSSLPKVTIAPTTVNFTLANISGSNGVFYSNFEGVTVGLVTLDFITIPISTFEAWGLSAHVLQAISTNGENGNYFAPVARAQRAGGGALMQNSAVGDWATFGIGGGSVTWILVGNSAVLRATGIAAQTIEWKASIEYMQMT